MFTGNQSKSGGITALNSVTDRILVCIPRSEASSTVHEDNPIVSESLVTCPLRFIPGAELFPNARKTSLSVGHSTIPAGPQVS